MRVTGEARRRHVDAHSISGGSIKMAFATVARADAVVVTQSAGDVDFGRTAVL